MAVSDEGGFIDLQLSSPFPEEMFYGVDLAWADGGGLGPEGVADQYIELRSRFRWFRPGNPERAGPREFFFSIRWSRAA